MRKARGSRSSGPDEPGDHGPVDPILACESLLNLVTFAIGTMFAHLAGAGVLSRDDAADRLRLLADTLSTVDVPVPEMAENMAARLEAMVVVIEGASTDPR